MSIQKRISVLVFCVALSAAKECKPRFQFVDPSVTPPATGEIIDVFGIKIFDKAVLPGRILNVEAKYDCETQPKCVVFYYNGTLTRKEKSPPFMMFGNAPGPIRAGVPPIYGREIQFGRPTLKACAYNNANCKSAPLGCKEESVVVYDECVNQVFFFDTLDAVSGSSIEFESEPKIYLSDYSDYGKLNINAFAFDNGCGKPPIGCVKMTFGSVVRKETLPPYTLYRSSGGTPPLGIQKLSACTYTDIHCKYGKQGCREMDVEVVAYRT